MFNPSNLYECEKEKKKKIVDHRVWDDRIMLLVGSIASFSSLPQVIKIFHTKEIAGLSLLTHIIALASVVAWFIYGVHIKNRPLTITTFISLIILLIVIIQIFVYK